MKRCPNCKTTNADNTIFCSSCGTKLSSVIPGAPATAMQFCTSCGTKIVPGLKFCENCGASVLESSEEPEDEAQPVVETPVNTNSDNNQSDKGYFFPAGNYSITMKAALGYEHIFTSENSLGDYCRSIGDPDEVGSYNFAGYPDFFDNEVGGHCYGLSFLPYLDSDDIEIKIENTDTEEELSIGVGFDNGLFAYVNSNDFDGDEDQLKEAVDGLAVNFIKRVIDDLDSEGKTYYEVMDVDSDGALYNMQFDSKNGFYLKDLKLEIMLIQGSNIYKTFRDCYCHSGQTDITVDFREGLPFIVGLVLESENEAVCLEENSGTRGGFICEYTSDGESNVIYNDIFSFEEEDENDFTSVVPNVNRGELINRARSFM